MLEIFVRSKVFHKLAGTKFNRKVTPNTIEKTPVTTRQKIFIVESKSYTYDEAFQSSLEYFKGDELAARVWVNKYALKDSFGNIYEKNPDDMHMRLATEIARIERNYPNPLSVEKLMELFRNFKYVVPQGSPMSGIGNNYQVGSLSNCFVG